MRAIVLKIYKLLMIHLTGYRLERYYLIRILHRAIYSYIRSGVKDDTIFDVDNHKMILSKSDFGIGIQGFTEKHVTNYFKTHVKPGMIAVDIGANIGYYTLLFARLVGEKGKVFAFEPEPRNYETLLKNIQMNDYKNVVPVKKAVANENKTIKLFLSPDNSVGHTIIETETNTQTIEIDAIRFDDYFKELGEKIDVIKIDIEGAEYSALQGMIGLLKQNKDIKIVMEYTPFFLNGTGVSAVASLKLLSSLGFRIFEISRIQKPTTIEKMSRLYNCNKDIGMNLLFIREPDIA